jgi:hypothetical protein
LRSFELLEGLGIYHATLVDFVRERKRTLTTVRVMRECHSWSQTGVTCGKEELKRRIEDALDVTSDEQRSRLRVTVVDHLKGSFDIHSFFGGYIAVAAA